MMGIAGVAMFFVVHDYSKLQNSWTLGNYRKQIGTKSIAKLGFNHEQSSFFLKLYRDLLG
jgi:hypothetical protein